MIKGFEDLKTDKNNSPTERPRIRWGNEVMEKVGRTSSPPSNIYNWWQQEADKRAKGLRNEIDENEIKAISKWVRGLSKWYKTYHSHPKKFEAVVNDEPCDWNELIKLRSSNDQH